MNVIYDENLAIQRKNKTDASRPTENKKAIIYNSIWTVAVTLVVVLISVLMSWCLFKTYDDAFLPNLAFLITLGLGGLYGGLILWNQFEPTYKPDEYYDALILYYIATKDKTILNHKLSNKHDNVYQLTLVLEDKSHIVTERTLICDFYKQVRSDISEVTVDLSKGTVCFPYNSEN